MSSPIALVLGAGANIGQAVGRKFTANGYKVALASRTASSEVTSQDAKDGLFYLTCLHLFALFDNLSKS